MARLALAIAYDGTRFEGFARQPGLRTVEGELLRLLTRHEFFEDSRSARFRLGSRTDRGVSAAWNVVAFDSRLPAEAIAAPAARAPEGLHLLSVADVAPDFDPRHARRRTYRYLLDAPWNWKRVGPVARMFEGEHDFSNFRRVDEGKPPNVRIDRIHYRARPPGPWIEFTAPFFLWHQVRRIVAALEGVAGGRWGTSKIRAALRKPKERADLGVAPAENLLLLGVEYDAVDWGRAPTVVRERLASDLRRSQRMQACLSAALGVAAAPARKPKR